MTTGTARAAYKRDWEQTYMRKTPPSSPALTDADVIAAIREHHLVIRAPGIRMWREATVDPGGTIFGPGPYAHLPILCDDDERIVVRVHAPARLRRRLAARWRPNEQQR